jgi:Fe2+ transport system protein FeoA
LDRAEAGREVVLECITEGGERDARLLGFMQDHHLFPGTKIEILEVAPSLGIMNLRVEKEEFALGIEAAKKLRVY